MVPQTWSIVTTCSEPKRLVKAFIAHHLAIGAEEIFLFCDDPADGTFEAFCDVPRVTAVLCDKKYWAENSPKKSRPLDHRKRQTLNANHAGKYLCKSKWLAHIDVDEFLYPRSEKAISDYLVDCPDDVDAVRILPAERMYLEKYDAGKFTLEGVFKLKEPKTKNWGEKLYGNIGVHFPMGFQGHSVGKSFKRQSNRNAVFNIHFVRENGKGKDEFKIPQAEAALLHLFPASFEDWCYKYERRIDTPEYFFNMKDRLKERYGLYGHARKEGGVEGTQQLFSKLCVLPSESPALTERPDLFIKPDLYSEERIQKYVTPFVNHQPLRHVSAPSEVNIDENERIFQIGMNRAGTRDLCKMFGRRGFSYAHWDNGRLGSSLSDAIRNNEKPFEGYERFQLISDISGKGKDGKPYDGFFDFQYILKYFPRSIFILNYRPVDEWIDSRARFRKGKYLKEHQRFLGFKSTEDVTNHWRRCWGEHVEKIRRLERMGKIRLIEFSINTEKPSRFFSQLDGMISARRPSI